MALRPRHKLAERIARKWLKAAGAPRMPAPHIRVQMRNQGYMSGRAWDTGRVHLSVGKRAARQDVWVLLAHELAHIVVFAEERSGDRGIAHHSPRFYWWFWRLLPRRHWARVVKPWGNHYPEYKPTTERVELLPRLGMGPLHPEAVA